MLKTIKLKRKLLNLLDNENEKTLINLELYTILLGYFSRKKDRTLIFFSEDELLFNLENRIKTILKTNYKILDIKDNSLDSFNIFIKNYSNDFNINTCNLLSEKFEFGYKYYDFYHNKYNSLFDYLIINKHKKLEYKLKNYID